MKKSNSQEDTIEKIKQDLQNLQPRADSFLKLFRDCLGEKRTLIFPPEIAERLLGTFLPYDLEEKYESLAPAVLDILSRPKTVDADYALADISLDVDSVELPVELPSDIIVGPLNAEERRLLFSSAGHKCLIDGISQESSEQEKIKAGGLLIFAASRLVLLDCSLAYRYMDIIHRLVSLGWQGPMAKRVDEKIQAAFQMPGSRIIHWPGA